MMAPSSKRRKLSSSKIPERKQARIRHAQEVAAKKAREGKLRDRAELRKQRKEDMEAHVAAVNKAMKTTLGAEESDDDLEDDDGQILEVEQEPLEVDREDEYIDEEKYTAVTVETVGISREGFTRVREDSDSEESGEEPHVANGREGLERSSRSKAGSNTKKRKKPFRYESKSERRITRLKQKGRSLGKSKRKT